jgi:hypothetical protein
VTLSGTELTSMSSLGLRVMVGIWDQGTGDWGGWSWAADNGNLPPRFDILGLYEMYRL